MVRTRTKNILLNGFCLIDEHLFIPDDEVQNIIFTYHFAGLYHLSGLFIFSRKLYNFLLVYYGYREYLQVTSKITSYARMNTKKLLLCFSSQFRTSSSRIRQYFHRVN